MHQCGSCKGKFCFINLLELQKGDSNHVDKTWSVFSNCLWQGSTWKVIKSFHSCGIGGKVLLATGNQLKQRRPRVVFMWHFQDGKLWSDCRNCEACALYRVASPFASAGDRALVMNGPNTGLAQLGILQNHRIVGVGRDLCGSPSPTPVPKQHHLELVLAFMQASHWLVWVGSCVTRCNFLSKFAWNISSLGIS